MIIGSVFYFSISDKGKASKDTHESDIANKDVIGSGNMVVEKEINSVLEGIPDSLNKINKDINYATSSKQ